MPRDTWSNLPAAKRERIIVAGMEEFGAKGFSAGSLNVVARNAGVAKGSLFQYFDDKLDFFATVCDQGAQRIASAVLADLPRDEVGYFETMRRLLPRWVRFHGEHPVERALAFAAANEIDRAARHAVRSVANAHYDRVLRPLADAAVRRGEFRPDADIEQLLSLTVILLRHMNTAPFDPLVDPWLALDRKSAGEVSGVIMTMVDTMELMFRAGV